MCIMIVLLLHGIGEEEKKVTVVRTWDYQGAAGVSVGETRRARPLEARNGCHFNSIRQSSTNCNVPSTAIR
jgi:hypothetical protein